MISTGGLRRLSENDLERLEGQIEGINFATEILTQLKETIKRQWITILILAILLFASNMIWLYAWQSYDYVSSVEATGVYTAVNQSGNIVTSDITEEQWKAFMEWINGNDENNKNQN